MALSVLSHLLKGKGSLHGHLIYSSERGSGLYKSTYSTNNRVTRTEGPSSHKILKFNNLSSNYYLSSHINYIIYDTC